eukprot:1177430-Prorocentrum_minimum.AAC.3
MIADLVLVVGAVLVSVVSDGDGDIPRTPAAVASEGVFAVPNLVGVARVPLLVLVSARVAQHPHPHRFAAVGRGRPGAEVVPADTHRGLSGVVLKCGGRASGGSRFLGESPSRYPRIRAVVDRRNAKEGRRVDRWERGGLGETLGVIREVIGCIVFWMHWVIARASDHATIYFVTVFGHDEVLRRVVAILPSPNCTFSPLNPTVARKSHGRNPGNTRPKYDNKAYN